MEGVLAHADEEVGVAEPLYRVVDVGDRAQRNLGVECIDHACNKPRIGVVSSIPRVKGMYGAHFDSMGTCVMISG